VNDMETLTVGVMNTNAVNSATTISGSGRLVYDKRVSLGVGALIAAPLCSACCRAFDSSRKHNTSKHRILKPVLGAFTDIKARPLCNACTKKQSAKENSASSKTLAAGTETQWATCQCGQRASFGIAGTKTALWCGSCAKEHEGVDFKSRICSCGKRASFGVASTNVGLWCSACAKAHGGVNIRSRKCPCGKTPSFGVTGTTARSLVCHVCQAAWRCECQAADMSVRQATVVWHCRHENSSLVCHVRQGAWRCECHKFANVHAANRPSFGVAGTKTPLWCATCAKEHGGVECQMSPQMPSVASEHRLVLLARSTPLWCATCAKEHGGVNINNRKCLMRQDSTVLRCCWHEDSSLVCHVCQGAWRCDVNVYRQMSMWQADVVLRHCRHENSPLVCTCAKEHGWCDDVSHRQMSLVASKHRSSVLPAPKLLFGVPHVPRSMEV
jgi:hypothetical protein